MKQAREHWENIYLTKNPEELSWTQKRPAISLDFIHEFQLPKTAHIIDIGGGDSKLVDFLLDENYENISVLDISEEALERARKRLGSSAGKVKWIVQDITGFKTDDRFDLWHDRAAFHFLTGKEQVAAYVSAAKSLVKTNGYLIIGTFSVKGPEKCSGLPVRQYNEEELTAAFSDGFEKIHCIPDNHITPFLTGQSFIFCSFRRI